MGQPPPVLLILSINIKTHPESDTNQAVVSAVLHVNVHLTPSPLLVLWEALTEISLTRLSPFPSHPQPTRTASRSPKPKASTNPAIAPIDQKRFEQR